MMVETLKTEMKFAIRRIEVAISELPLGAVASVSRKVAIASGLLCFLSDLARKPDLEA